MQTFVLLALLAASPAADPPAEAPDGPPLTTAQAAAVPSAGGLRLGEARRSLTARYQAASDGPLGVEHPAGFGSRFALGVDLATERLEDLDLTSFEFAADLEQFDFTPPVDDPEDARRDTELTSIGVQLPIALPRLGPLSMALVVEAASIDGELELPVANLREDTRDVEFRTASFRGDGTLIGAGLETMTSLGAGGGAFLGAGYRFRTLRGFDVDPDVQGVDDFGVTVLPAQLDRDDHQLTARLGWSLAGGRFAPYAGARAHRTEIAVSGGTDFFGELVVPTRLELESEEVVGLAGVDLRLGPFLGRLEGTFGGDRETVLLKLVRGFGRPAGSAPSRRPAAPAPSPAAPEDPLLEEKLERARQLADTLAPRLREIQQRFEEGRRNLDTVGSAGGPVYSSRQLLALLQTTEADLMAALEAAELAPLRAWIEDFFRRLREELPEGSVARALRSSGERPRPVFASLAAAAQQGGAGSARARQESVLDRVSGFLAELLARTEAGELATDICLQSRPEPGVEIRLFPPRYAQRTLVEVTERTVRVVYRGLYAYEVERKDGESFACRDRSCPLVDLWLNDGPFIECDFAFRRCVPRTGDLGECRQR